MITPAPLCGVTQQTHKEWSATECTVHSYNVQHKHNISPYLPAHRATHVRKSRNARPSGNTGAGHHRPALHVSQYATATACFPMSCPVRNRCAMTCRCSSRPTHALVDAPPNSTLMRTRQHAPWRAAGASVQPVDWLTPYPDRSVNTHACYNSATACCCGSCPTTCIWLAPYPALHPCTQSKWP